MSAGELEETDTAEISEDLEILKDFRKKRKVTIFSALGIAAAAVLVIWLVFFRWICVPYDLVKPEVSVLETSGETESGAACRRDPGGFCRRDLSGHGSGIPDLPVAAGENPGSDSGRGT